MRLQLRTRDISVARRAAGRQFTSRALRVRVRWKETLDAPLRVRDGN